VLLARLVFADPGHPREHGLLVRERKKKLR
jgi:hypothetical protein